MGFMPGDLVQVKQVYVRDWHEPDLAEVAELVVGRVGVITRRFFRNDGDDVVVVRFPQDIVELGELGYLTNELRFTLRSLVHFAFEIEELPV